MFNLQSVINSIKELIQEIEKSEMVDSEKARMLAMSFLTQFKNAVLLIRWNHLYLKHGNDNKDKFTAALLNLCGEPLSKQDLQNIKKQTRELSGYINTLCNLLNVRRSELNLLDDF